MVAGLVISATTYTGFQVFGHISPIYWYKSEQFGICGCRLNVYWKELLSGHRHEMLICTERCKGDRINARPKLSQEQEPESWAETLFQILSIIATIGWAFSWPCVNHDPNVAQAKGAPDELSMVRVIEFPVDNCNDG